MTYFDNNITFVMAAEQGPKNISVLVDGQWSNVLPFVFELPVITGLTVGSSGISTDGAKSVTITGANFGTRGASVSVTFNPLTVTVYTGDSGPGADFKGATSNASASDVPTTVEYVRGILPAVCNIVSQSHTALVVDIPAGMGPNVSLRVQVSTQMTLSATPEFSTAVSNGWTFDYAEPVITNVVPNVLNAAGQSGVKLYGRNFGFLSSTLLTENGTLPPPVVHFNGRPCLNAVLQPSQGACCCGPVIVVVLQA